MTNPPVDEVREAMTLSEIEQALAICKALREDIEETADLKRKLEIAKETLRACRQFGVVDATDSINFDDAIDKTLKEIEDDQ